MAEKKNTSTSKAKASKSSSKKKQELESVKAARLALEEEAKAKLKKKKTIRSEIMAIVIIALGVFFALSMLTNTCGNFGFSIKSFIYGLFGVVSYVIPFFMVIFGILVFAEKTTYLNGRTLICILLLFVLLSALSATFFGELKGITVIEDISEEIDYSEIWSAVTTAHSEHSVISVNAGVIGTFIAYYLIKSIGRAGLFISTGAGIIIMILLIFNTPLSQLVEKWKMKRAIKASEKGEEYEKKLAKKEAEILRNQQNAEANISEIPNTVKQRKNVFDTPIEKKELTQTELPSLNISAFNDGEVQTSANETSSNKRKIFSYMNDDDVLGSNKEAKQNLIEEEEKKPAKITISKTEIEEQAETMAIETDAAATPDDYKFPPITLLKKNSASKSEANKTPLQNQANLLEDTLLSFGVNASVIDVVKGPSVTRFEVQPAPGVQVSKIVHLQDDIALNLRAKSIRIEAPIPGKADVGIEVSNDTNQAVLLRDLVDSKEFKSNKSKIAVTLGKSITGENIICDLHEMPHLLIAGTTGSGKSVCIDSMLTSILYHAKPSEVKLILIDPKIVELTPFNGIPHLLIPVVTEPNKAAVALTWAVNEMNQRYNKFADEGVKDLRSYNESVKFKGEAQNVMPEIVIVIDELADLIMAAKNQVEDSICRLAQKARAAGMHLLIATQRPSTDIITGVIKANIPSRIALSVSSLTDSRVILDMGGAEHLLGKGDMLYCPQSLSKPIRIQGTYISDEELHSVIDFVTKDTQPSEYNAEIINQMDKVGVTNNIGSSSADANPDEELFMDVLETIVSTQSCSTSLLQRRFRIGYSKAARIVDMLEERGIVSAMDGNRPRKVLMNKEEYEEYIQRIKEYENV